MKNTSAINEKSQAIRPYLLKTPTLYASPYIVATNKGYTKHYYAEDERIASRIGMGGLAQIDSSWISTAAFTTKHAANYAEMSNHPATPILRLIA